MGPRRINVIDMYHGNVVRTSDFAVLKANGIFGIIHKASQGLNYIDPQYALRRKIAEDAGLLWGAYHFLDNSNPIDQATSFLKASGISEQNSDPILLACDYENSPHQPTLQQAMMFMSYVDRNSPSGVECVLYSGNLIRETLHPQGSGHQDQSMIAAENFFKLHRLWLAEYGPKEQVPWPWSQPIVKSSDEATAIAAPGVWLWQFTETGRLNPLVNNTDGNFFDGTFEELKTRWLS